MRVTVEELQQCIFKLSLQCVKRLACSLQITYTHKRLDRLKISQCSVCYLQVRPVHLPPIMPACLIPGLRYSTREHSVHRARGAIRLTGTEMRLIVIAALGQFQCLRLSSRLAPSTCCCIGINHRTPPSPFRLGASAQRTRSATSPAATTSVMSTATAEETQASRREKAARAAERRLQNASISLIAAPGATRPAASFSANNSSSKTESSGPAATRPAATRKDGGGGGKRGAPDSETAGASGVQVGFSDSDSSEPEATCVAQSERAASPGKAKKGRVGSMDDFRVKKRGRRDEVCKHDDSQRGTGVLQFTGP